MASNEEDNANPQEFLPPFANEANKQLKQATKDAEKRLAQIDIDLESNDERIRIMSEHLRAVQVELPNTQRLLEAKSKEIQTEDHLRQLVERDRGRTQAELVKLQKDALDVQDQLNVIQNNIFKGNEKMEQFKVLMNWNQEELEQWALAARQKEDDNLALQKYMRSDEVKLKELNLQIEKFSKEVQRKKSELDSEVTATQAAQIELDKAAEDFRALHKERQELIQQWEEAIDAMQRRDESIKHAGERYVDGKTELRSLQEQLAEKGRLLETLATNNREEEAKIAMHERLVGKLRMDLVTAQQGLTTFQDEFEVVKNTLSKVATDLASRKSEIMNLKADMDDRKRKLDKQSKHLDYTKQKFESELQSADDLETRAKEVEQMFKQEEMRLRQIDRELVDLKEYMFKQSQELFKQRQEEATLIAEISGSQAANKNMQAKIQRLDAQTLKQQELIYNAEFEIQQLERKVARASGERTDEEKRLLNAKIITLQQQLDEQAAQYGMLIQQSKRLADELRAARRKVTDHARVKAGISENIADLNLQIETLSRKLKQVIRSKEEALVQHDVLKLDVKRLREALNLRSDEVFGLENRKMQLRMTMEQREKEVKVLIDQQRMEYRLSEDERHKVALELNEKTQKVDKLEKKYTIMVSRLPQEEGEEERTQAYYVIKAAQMREELQREGDELDAKIRKTEKEVRALEQTLDALMNANGEYRLSFTKVGSNAQELDEKRQLEEQHDKAVRTVKFRKRETEALQQDVQAMKARLENMRKEEAVLRQRVAEVEARKSQLEKEIDEQRAKKDRALKTLVRYSKDIRRAAKVPDSEETVAEKDVRLQELKLANKTVVYQLTQLAKEHPEIAGALEQALMEAGLRALSRPPSGLVVGSSMNVSSTGRISSRPSSAGSTASRDSVTSRGSVRSVRSSSSSKGSAVSQRSGTKTPSDRPSRPMSTVQLSL